jgi:minor extracellular serine protease Vpr
MNRTLFAVLAATALLLAAAVPAGLTADPPGRTFTHLAIGKIDPALRPALLDTKRQVTVILQLAGKPVLERVGLTHAQKATVRADLKASQAKLDKALRTTGARILASYQVAYDGIKVRVDVSSLVGLTQLPGVVAIRPVSTYTIDNTVGVPFIGGDSAWQDARATGAGVGVAVIDTGIDYYHADFGGSGNPEDFANDNGLTVGTAAFPNAKVVGGTDFVGDDYNADSSSPSYQPVPHPDPDPLDCVGHGSHVAGTAAGDGVLSDGSTYTGPYNATTLTSHSFRVGPGVAPQASIYALRVFGCEGPSNAVTDALEWVAAYNLANPGAVDVVNMSLGSSFGRNTNPESVMSNNLASSGVVVVASAGNAGGSAYLTGAPGSATSVISVAAIETLANFPTANIGIGAGIQAINANGSSALPVTGNVRVLADGAGGIALGCAQSEYGGVVAGDIVVTKRGVCDRVDRARNGQAAHAAAVIMVNNAAGLPPFDGEIPGVTIPFLGVDPSATDALLSADRTSVTITAAGIIANPGFKRVAAFSSGGPRNGDSAAKPDITAPGVSVASVGMGTGTQNVRMSGTSMAAPHTAGVAALVREHNPTWSPAQVKAAIMNTADATSSHILGFDVRVAGSGVVRARRAVDTVGLATTGTGTSSLSFGYEPLGGGYNETQQITLWNRSGRPITYNLASDNAAARVSPARVTVAAGSSATVAVTLSQSAAQVAALASVDVFTGSVGWGAVTSIRGAITASPRSSDPGVYPLQVPWILVPRGLSRVTAGDKAPYTQSSGVARTRVALSNGGIHSGNADVYAWGLHDASGDGFEEMDVRDVGVQSFAAGSDSSVPGDRYIVFAVNSYGTSSTAAVNEYDIALDTNHNGKIDYFVVGVDFGLVTAGAFDGRVASFVFDATGNIVDAFVGDAPMNGSTILLPALASDLGLKSGNSDFSYALTAFSLENGAVDAVPGTARFDAYKPAVSQANFIPLAPGAGATLELSVDRGKFASSPSNGWLIVTLDDANDAQAQEIPVGRLP